MTKKERHYKEDVARGIDDAWWQQADRKKTSNRQGEKKVYEYT